MRPSRDEFRAPGERAHGGAGVDRGAGRPRDAGRRVRQARRRRARGSCSSRSSTANAGAGTASSVAIRSRRSSCATAVITTFGNVPSSVPLDAGMLAALDELLRDLPRADHPRPAAAAERRDGVPRLRRRPRGRAAARRAARRPPTARRGDERDRFAGRVRPLAAARVPDRERAGARDWTATSWIEAYDAAMCRVERAVADLARPLAVRAGRAAAGRRRDARRPQHDAQRHVPTGGRGRQGAHRRRRHLPGRAGAALRHRPRGRPVRLLPRAAPGQPEPVHVLPAASRHHHRRQLARADGAGARPQGDQPARSPAPAGAAATTITIGAWPAS